MASKKFIGESFPGIINLRINDKINNTVNPYVIQTGAIIVLNFPGAGVGGAQGASVQLSSATLGEITVVDPTASKITFFMSVAKSLLLFVTKSAAVDCVITNLDGTVQKFEAVSVYQFATQANP